MGLLPLVIVVACESAADDSVDAGTAGSPDGADVLPSEAADAESGDASCATRGLIDPTIAPFPRLVGPGGAARSEQILYGPSSNALGVSCEAISAAQITRVVTKPAGSVPAADAAVLCFGYAGNAVVTAYSADGHAVGAVATATGASTGAIYVAIVPEEDPAWSATLAGRSATEKLGIYPELGAADAGDGGLIAGQRVSRVGAAAYVGGRLLVVGSTPEVNEKGLSLLFAETGKSNPRALWPTALVEPRARSFEAVAMSASGGAWIAGPSASGRVALARLTPTNQLDATFGSGGLLDVGDVVAAPSVHGVGEDAAGRVIVVHSSSPTVDGGPGSSPRVTRVLPSGAIDTSFGKGGQADVPLVATPSYARFGVIVERGGGTLVGGVVPTPGQPTPLRSGIVRLDETGRIDESFGGPGAGGYAVAPLPPGKGPDDTLDPLGVILPSPAPTYGCRSHFFALFAEDPQLGFVLR